MPEYIGISLRKIVDMGAVGIGERVDRQALRGARQQLGDAGYFARKDRVPAFKELRVGEIDTKRGAQACKELGVTDLALLVAPIKFVARKPPDQMRRLASGVTGPAGKRSVEVDIEHHAAEIEQ